MLGPQLVPELRISGRISSVCGGTLALFLAYFIRFWEYWVNFFSKAKGNISINRPLGLKKRLTHLNKKKRS